MATLSPPRFGLWQAIKAALDLSIRAMEEVRTLAARPGTPGRDGLGFDDMAMEYDGERSFTFVFRRGEDKRRYSFHVPIPIYRGIYRPESRYERGDQVTFSGSQFTAIADAAPDERPETSKAWTLSVKRGRDGKDGKLPSEPKPVKLGGKAA